MHGAAITLAEKVRSLERKPDLIIVSDMLDLATFDSLCGSITEGVKKVIYFHENQITYPWSANDQDIVLNRDNHYGFINYTSALSADAVFFNSEYHKRSFVNALPDFLKQFPDHQNLSSIEQIKEKSSVLHLGMNLSSLNEVKPEVLNQHQRAVILWNHRWEYDKNPAVFFEALCEIQERGWEFNLVVLGEQFSSSPKVFDEAKEKLKNTILHWGYAESREEYVNWLWQSDIIPVTSVQDFFGGSIVEAMFCNVKPLLPKRLAYSEHVPSNLHHVFFYEEGELVNKLQRWIKDISVLRKQQTRSFVEKYDWSEIVGQYDDVLERCFQA
jgi:glycosyltransferase involved in cell wall biosynthesis